MKIVEPNLTELLNLTHRRWINERTLEAERQFERALSLVFDAARKSVKGEHRNG